MSHMTMPINEEARLAALHSSALLDTPPEERFDRITGLARQLFDVQMAGLSLVDHDRQFFKSRSGLDLESTARTDSFCGHALTHAGAFVVEDASIEPRFSHLDLVRKRGVLSYALFKRAESQH